MKKLSDCPIEPILVVLVTLLIFSFPVIALFKLWNAVKPCFVNP